ncbi:MAG: hypothetical protein ACYTE1_11095 [Planctomycetota bacterium]
MHTIQLQGTILRVVGTAPFDLFVGIFFVIIAIITVQQDQLCRTVAVVQFVLEVDGGFKARCRQAVDVFGDLLQDL